MFHTILPTSGVFILFSLDKITYYDSEYKYFLGIARSRHMICQIAMRAAAARNIFRLSTQPMYRLSIPLFSHCRSLCLSDCKVFRFVLHPEKFDHFPGVSSVSQCRFCFRSKCRLSASRPFHLHRHRLWYPG